MIDWPSGPGQLSPGWIHLRKQERHVHTKKTEKPDAGLPVPPDAGAEEPPDAGKDEDKKDEEKDAGKPEKEKEKEKEKGKIRPRFKFKLPVKKKD